MARAVVTLGPIGADLPSAPGNAHRRWTRRDGALVRVQIDGRVGLGEASPLPGVSRESLEEVRASLGSLALDVALDTSAALFDSLAPLELPSSARFGLETALADVASQRAGLPLARFLSTTPSRAVRVQAMLDRLDGELPEGAVAVKVKVGRAGHAEDEIAQLRALRRRFPALLVRADANGAALEPALAAALREVGCALVEDPGSPVDLPRAIDQRFAVDPRLALAELGPQAPWAVLKPTLVGGLARTLSLAAEARARGAQVIVSHALESPIALAAAAHLALALGDEHAVHGLGPYAGIERFEAEGVPLAPPPWIDARGITLPDRAGLGVP